MGPCQSIAIRRCWERGCPGKRPPARESSTDGSQTRLLRSPGRSSHGRDRQGIAACLGWAQRPGGGRSRGCPLRSGLLLTCLPKRARSCICTVGRCELVGEMEGKPRQRFLRSHKWLSGCWRSIAPVPAPRHASSFMTALGNEPACCWRPALPLGEAPCQRQRGGSGTPSPLCQLAAPALEIQPPPAACETPKQMGQNLVSRHCFTITGIINIKPSKPSCAGSAAARAGARAEFLSAVVIATGAAGYRQPLCNSQLHLQKYNLWHKAPEQRQRPKARGQG